MGHIQIRFDGCHVKKVREKLRDCTHIESLGVKEEFRKKGIATKLIKFTEELSKKKGFDKIGLSVEEDNDFLKKIYDKRGYKDWKKGTIIEEWNECKLKNGKSTSKAIFQNKGKIGI